MKFSRSLVTRVGVATLVLAAAGTASVAQARSDVYFSIGANVAPGVVIGASNAPYYYQPAYAVPQPVYVQPAPVYYEPAPVYYRPAPVYYRPAPVYYRPASTYYSHGAPVVRVTYYYHNGRRYQHRHWNGSYYQYW